ncbi:pyrimidine/purine nucleotide monophosphate nucleosidase domain-containing protein, partial [Pseudoalteromonas sp. S1691]|uniref:pyrimidine/purine nucleotide monophosphate nucleosidase domain-containing protein n=1 Tax=Pseudoalteromonas sp. S1691 TaxID=579513 RepID=UPI00110C9E2F
RKCQLEYYKLNWKINIENEYKQPVAPTHENMASLDLHLEQPKQQLAANLRRALSGIVAGNVKEEGLRAITAPGPSVLSGGADLMKALDKQLP